MATIFSILNGINEAPLPPGPPPGGPGGLKPPGGGLGPPGGGLPPMPPPPPMGGGLGGLGGLGGGLGGPPGGDQQQQQPAETKIVKSGDVWEMLRKAAKDMDRYKELNLYYKSEKSTKKKSVKKTHKSLE